MGNKAKNTLFETMDFDLIIIGNGLQAALILAQATSKGLKTALISDKDCAEPINQSPFIVVDPISNYLFSQFPFHTNLIKSLKKSFAHLFIYSDSSHYSKINFVEKLIVKIIGFFLKMKISYQPKNQILKLPNISFSSHKFSTIRISLALLKEAVKEGATIYHHTNTVFAGLDENRNYRIQLTDKKGNRRTNISCKNILTFNMNYQHQYLQSDKLADKNLSYFYFTYPSQKLDIQKNLIYTNKNESLNIIPWFDIVYFEYANQKAGCLTIDNAIQLIKDKFVDFQIDKSLVLTSGVYKMSSYSENRNKIQLVYFNDEKQINYKYKPVIQWFDYSDRICNQIVKQIKKGKQSTSIIGKTLFPGSNLPDTSNPLRIMEYADEKYDQARQILKSPLYFKKLFYRYGTEVEKITEKAYQYWNETKNSQYSWLKAEIAYCMEHEFCQAPDDFIQNRCELWMQGQSDIIREVENIFQELANSNRNCS